MGRMQGFLPLPQVRVRIHGELFGRTISEVVVRDDADGGRVLATIGLRRGSSSESPKACPDDEVVVELLGGNSYRVLGCHFEAQKAPDGVVWSKPSWRELTAGVAEVILKICQAAGLSELAPCSRPTAFPRVDPSEPRRSTLPSPF